MSIEIVHKFLSLPIDLNDWGTNGWKLIRDRNTFLCIDWGLETEEIIKQWNVIVPEKIDLSIVSDSAPSSTDYTDHITCNEKSISVNYSGSREDCFIAVLSINQLTIDKLETRLCSESIGNSDWCFLPLSHIAWKELEIKYGEELLNRKFIRLPKTWPELEGEVTRRSAELTSRSSNDTSNDKTVSKSHFSRLLRKLFHKST